MAHRDRRRKANLLRRRKHRFDGHRMVGGITPFTHQLSVVRALQPEVSV
jgi:hypothetical protein